MPEKSKMTVRTFFLLVAIGTITGLPALLRKFLPSIFLYVLMARAYATTIVASASDLPWVLLAMAIPLQIAAQLTASMARTGRQLDVFAPGVPLFANRLFRNRMMVTAVLYTLVLVLCIAASIALPSGTLLLLSSPVAIFAAIEIWLCGRKKKPAF